MTLIQIALLTAALLQSALINAKVVLPTAMDYYIKGLEKFGAEDEMYAGLMPITWSEDTEGGFFFWLAKQRMSDAEEEKANLKSKHHQQKKEKKQKLVIWLNGGPGCSSMVGMFWENGPFHIQQGSKQSGKKYDLPRNAFSWNEVAHVLYVEQPIRTGFSAAAAGADIIRNERQVARDFRNFLISFMTIFPEYKGMELFLTGESYAGAYIPWIAEHIVEQQLVPLLDADAVDDFYYSVSEADEAQHLRSLRGDGINLVGVAIGNGVIDYMHQEPSYAEYAYTHGLIPLGAKLKIDYDLQQCFKQMQADGVPPTRASFDRCNTMSKVLEAAGLPNEYNTATFKPYSDILKPDSAFQNFFSDPLIQEMLHVRGYNIPGLVFEPELLLPQQQSAGITQDDDLLPNGDPLSHHRHQHHKHHHNHADDDRGGKHFHHDFADDTDDHGDDTDDYDDDDDDAYKGVYYKPPNGWSVCNDDINDAMSADHPITIVPTLQFLSEAPTFSKDAVALDLNSSDSASISAAVSTARKSPSSVRVLLYSGEFDLNCNTLGTLHTLEANNWRGRPWSEAARSLWVDKGEGKEEEDKEVAGEYFTMDGAFSFLIVRNSGHLLPMDLPRLALDMLDRFLNEESFADRKLPSEADYLQQLQEATAADAAADAAVAEGASTLSLTGAQSSLSSLVLVLGVTALAVALTLYVIYQLRKTLGRSDYVPLDVEAATVTTAAGVAGSRAPCQVHVHDIVAPALSGMTSANYQQREQQQSLLHQPSGTGGGSTRRDHATTGEGIAMSAFQLFTQSNRPLSAAGHPRRNNYQQL